MREASRQNAHGSHMKSGLLPMAICRWIHSHDLTEQAREVIRIRDARLMANRIYLHWSSIEQFTGMLDFKQIEI